MRLPAGPESWSLPCQLYGQRGELRQRYYEDMEDPLGALGLVLNAIVLFTTRYLDAAIKQLHADGYEVRAEDAARLSLFVRHHINMLGRCSFLTPELAGLRPLRDPSAPDEDELASPSRLSRLLVTPPVPVRGTTLAG